MDLTPQEAAREAERDAGSDWGTDKCQHGSDRGATYSAATLLKSAGDEKESLMSLIENGRRRRTTLFAVAGLGGSLALWLAACAPSSAVAAGRRPSHRIACDASTRTYPAGRHEQRHHGARVFCGGARADTGGHAANRRWTVAAKTAASGSQSANRYHRAETAMRVTVTANRTFEPPSITITP